MNEKQKYLFGIPSWILSLLISFLLMILMFFIDGLIGSIPGIDKDTSEGIGYIVYGILIAIAGFYICKKNPGSIWYVPILINSVGIISALVEPNFWITDLWIYICIGWVLSLIGTLTGAGIGHRTASRKLLI